MAQSFTISGSRAKISVSCDRSESLMSIEMTRTATCRCGQLSATFVGEPVRISVCHCLKCQRRSGSSFTAQARFTDVAITILGQSKIYEHAGDSGTVGVFHFCPDCGATVFYKAGPFPDLTAIAIGAFADPTFPAPAVSIYENRKHRRVEIVGEDIEHD